jgi:hypothetical protein
MAIGDAMRYDNLWGIAELADWRLVNFEYNALAVAAFVVAAILIWNRIRNRKRIRMIEAKVSKVEAQLSKLQKQISTLLQIQIPLIMRLNGKSRVGIDPRDIAVEMGGSDVAELTMSPPTMPAEPESLESAKFPG